MNLFILTVSKIKVRDSHEFHESAKRTNKIILINSCNSLTKKASKFIAVQNDM